jgi:hypothetical protein
MSEHWSTILLRILKGSSIYSPRGVQAAQVGQQQAGQTPTPTGTTPQPKPYGSKLATKIGKIGTGIASGKQGQKIGEWAGGQAEQAAGVLGEFVREKAGIGGGAAAPAEQSQADQEVFQQQSGRSSGGGQTARLRRQNQRAFRSNTKKSFNPALASLLAVSAGFAASDAVVNASGARGARSITDDQLNLFNVMANKRRGRKLRKEHAPLPPIQGLVWDEGAKRWRKPENVGKTASEVQGKKRIRGSALGQTAKTPGGTAAGKGRGREFSRGRAQRIASGDFGVAGIPGKSSKLKRRRKRKGK